MCARRRLHPGVCFATVQSCQRFSWDFNCVSSILVCHFCPHGRLLGHLAGVRKFLSAFFHWKAAVHGAWVRGRVCFFFGKGRWKGCESDEGKRERVTHKVSPAGCCVSYICIWVCVWRGPGSVRDSDGAERVWCTVITLSGMWLSWELLALGTWENELLFKGKLPSLYRLLAFPPLMFPTLHLPFLFVVPLHAVF